MGMDVVGRLKPGVSLEQADGDMQAVARGLADQYRKSTKNRCHAGSAQVGPGRTRQATAAVACKRPCCLCS